MQTIRKTPKCSNDECNNSEWFDEVDYFYFTNDGEDFVSKLEYENMKVGKDMFTYEKKCTGGLKTHKVCVRAEDNRDNTGFIMEVDSARVRYTLVW